MISSSLPHFTLSERALAFHTTFGGFAKCLPPIIGQIIGMTNKKFSGDIWVEHSETANPPVI